MFTDDFSHAAIRQFESKGTKTVADLRALVKALYTEAMRGYVEQTHALPPRAPQQIRTADEIDAAAARDAGTRETAAWHYSNLNNETLLQHGLLFDITNPDVLSFYDLVTRECLLFVHRVLLEAPQVG
ncbi:hypothetical protein FACS1894198_5420 [Clostridia bacterium]|nr:hypothetical protein FACS1894198_5420 [Clostridia bacterium]